MELSQTTSSALQTFSTHPQHWTPYRIFGGFFGIGILVPAETGPPSAPELKLLTHTAVMFDPPLSSH